MSFHRSRRTSRILPLAMAALVPLAAAAASDVQASDALKDRTITVSASATVAVPPDMAHFVVGVTTEAASARDALSQNNANVAKLIEGLKKAGIAATDLRTSGLALYPRYSQGKANAAPKIDGYQASNTLRVTVRELAKLGDLLDQTITLGANQIQGIQFEASKAETLRDEARKEAMVNARRRAELYATAAGAKVGPVLSISESIAGIQPRRQNVQMRAASAESVPVEPGTQGLEATVHVVFALQ
jgi:uncharacterized protein